MSNTKKIDVAEIKHGHLQLDELINFQGTLKMLTEDTKKRLRRSILKYKFSFPIYVWEKKLKTGIKNYILDGHQRISVLKDMREEGYKIPKLPVTFIPAKTQKEAKEKLLIAVSQYGILSNDSFNLFLDDANIELDDIIDSINIPTLDLRLVEIPVLEFADLEKASKELTGMEDVEILIVVPKKYEEEVRAWLLGDELTKSPAGLGRGIMRRCELL